MKGFVCSSSKKESQIYQMLGKGLSSRNLLQLAGRLKSFKGDSHVLFLCFCFRIQFFIFFRASFLIAQCLCGRLFMFGSFWLRSQGQF